MAEKFIPKEATIGSLLKNNKFKIPKYQRYYSWDEQAIVFLEDILEIHSRKEEYFTGPMIFSEDNKILTIIDGQQRLITSSIILSAIRDLCNSRGLQETANSIGDKYLIEKEVYSSGDVRVSANRIDKELLDLIVKSKESYENKEKQIKSMLKNNKIDSWKNMWSFFSYCYNRLSDIISKLKENEADNVLKEIVKTFDELVKVIAIEVKDDLEAYLIFETLNDRGLPLSISDLLKNYLFSKIEEAEIDEFEIKWNNLSEDVNSNQFIQLIRYYWISQRGFVRLKDLFKKIKLEIKDAIKAKSFIKSVEEFKKYYNQLVSPSFEYWKNQNVVNWLDDLHLCNFSQHIPVMFSLIQKKNKSIEKELWVMYSIIMRRILSGKNPNELEQRLQKICAQINKEDYDSIKNLMNEINPSDEELVAAITTSEFLVSREKKLARTILRLWNNNQSTEVDTKKELTLEHIWPQSRKSELKESINVHKIGNLTLLTSKDNIELGNKDLIDKLNILEHSDLEINKDLHKDISSANPNKWKDKEIKERSKKVADKVKNILK
ncbi:MAG: DUF262 domain-containing HNH endonuclease family protein [Nanoarchaeota archaeon]